MEIYKFPAKNICTCLNTKIHVHLFEEMKIKCDISLFVCFMSCNKELEPLPCL